VSRLSWNLEKSLDRLFNGMPCPESSTASSTSPSTTVARSRMNPSSTNLLELRLRFSTICFSRRWSVLTCKFSGHSIRNWIRLRRWCSIAATGSSTSLSRSVGFKWTTRSLLAARWMSSMFRSRSWTKCSAFEMTSTSSLALLRASAVESGFGSFTACLTKLHADMAAATGFRTSWLHWRDREGCCEG
jgi:hypothetical protein